MLFGPQSGRPARPFGIKGEDVAYAHSVCNNYRKLDLKSFGKQFAITQCAMIAASWIADSVDAASILNLLSVAKS